MKQKIADAKEIRRERPTFRAYVKSRVWVVIEKRFMNKTFTTSDLAKKFEEEFGRPISLTRRHWYLSQYVKLGHLAIVGRHGKYLLYRVSKKITSTNKERINQDPMHADIEKSLLSIATSEIRHVYGKMRKSLLALGSVKMISKRRYLEFVHKRSFAFVVIGKSELTVYLALRKGKLKDPRNLATDVSQMGHWGSGDYAITLESRKQLAYALKLLNQAYACN